MDKTNGLKRQKSADKEEKSSDAYIHLRIQGEDGHSTLQWLIPMSDIAYSLDELKLEAKKEEEGLADDSEESFWFQLAEKSVNKKNVHDRRYFDSRTENIVLFVVSYL